MPKISILPEDLRGKIAAGEVIERPASVIKELLENAFDAKASLIRVELHKGGVSKISVYDNGEGITGEDLKLCYLPFATSKIKKMEDLFNLKSYGFRGEALSSIAQVSRLKIVSKSKEEDLAHEIYVEFGKEKLFKPTHFNEGTLVVVEDLFANLPARRAFLKSTKVESSKNLELIRILMLTHPEVAFEVLMDGKRVYHWRGGSLKKLLVYLCGLNENSLWEITHENSLYRVQLILSGPEETFSHSKNLFFMVNRRAIRDEKLNRVFFPLLKKFYGALGFPGGIVHIEVSPSMVDFNVHPAKWEVRFRKERELYQCLEEALGLLFEKRRKRLYPEKRSQPSDHRVREDLPLEYEVSKGPSPTKGVVFEDNLRKTLLEIEEDFKILGSFKEAYILVEKEDNLFIVDHHALSERVCYDFLKNRASLTMTQSLLLPMIIKLTPEMMENLDAKLEILTQVGFELELFGREELLVKGAPSEFVEDLKEALEGLLMLPIFSKEEAKEAFIKELACLLARKKGNVLSEDEKRFLIKKMFSESLDSCPHGRPLFIRITLMELEKKLKRIL